MASVSYLSDIDTRPVDIKPTNLPWESFFKEFGAKQQYFSEGVLQVQSAYNNVLGLNPAFKDNQIYLKEFLKSSEKELGKVVKADMTISDNVNRAKSVFTPIFNTSDPRNANLLKDAELNKFYQSEMSKVEQARKTGKWHKDNEYYMRSQYAEYMNAAQNEDPSNIDYHYNNRKGYIPYYDPLPDIEKVVKLCKEDSENITGINPNNPMYFETNNSQGVSVHKMMGCLSMLPPMARQQIGISSYAQYHGRPQELLTDYKNLVVGNLEKELKGITSALAFLPANPTTEEEKVLKQKLQNAQTITKERYDEAQNSWNSMLGSNSEIDYIKQNFTNLAEQVGFNQFINRAATTLSYNNIEKELSLNSAVLAKWKAENDWNRDILNFRQEQYMAKAAYEYERKLLEYKSILEGMGTGVDPFNSTTPGITGIILPQNSAEATDRDKFDKEYQDSKDLLTGSINGLRNSFQSYITNNPNLDEKEKQILLSNSKDINGISDDGLINLINAYEKNAAAFGATDPMLEAQITNFRQALQSKKRYDMEQEAILSTVDFSELEKTSYTFNHNGKNHSFSRMDLYNMVDRQKPVRGYTYTKAGLLGLNYITTPSGETIKITTSHPLATAIYSGVGATKSKVETDLKTAFKTRNAQIKENYLLNLPTKKADEEFNFKIRQQFGVPEVLSDGSTVDFGQKSRTQSGDVYIKLNMYNKIKDEISGLTNTKPTTKTVEEMKQIISNPRVEFEDRQGNMFMVLKNYYDPVNLMSQDNFNILTLYTQNNLPKVKQGEFSVDPLEITNNKGINYRIYVGNVNDITGKILYKVQRENKDKKTWQTFQTMFEDVRSVLALIDTNLQ